MAIINNSTCDICGKKYHVCKTCQGIKSFLPWRTVTDTLPHYQIYLIISEYTKTKNKSVAKEELSKCDLSELESFREDIKNVIKEIVSEDVQSVEEQMKLESVENTEMTEIKIEESVIEKSEPVKRKKNTVKTEENDNE